MEATKVHRPNKNLNVKFLNLGEYKYRKIARNYFC